MHIFLQKILKSEEDDKLDEYTVVKLEDDILQSNNKLVQKFKEYKNMEKERKHQKRLIQSAFIQRIGEIPFCISIDPQALTSPSD